MFYLISQYIIQYRIIIIHLILQYWCTGSIFAEGSSCHELSK